MQINQILKRTWAEIDLNQAEQNLNVLISLLEDKYAAMCVIKADAYGHGDTQLMQLYQNMGIKFFAVSNLDEAVRLRDFGCLGDIIILSWSPPEPPVPQILAQKDIIQTIVSYEHALELSKNAKMPIRTHIKLDTGMGRVGLNAYDKDECTAQIAKIAAMPNIIIEGIFTHFAVADSLDPDKTAYTNSQKDLFFAVIQECEKNGVYFKYKHFANSAAAILHGAGETGNLARLGITLYGLTPDIGLKLPSGVKPIMSLKSRISQVKTLKKDQTIGYGRTYTAKEDIKTATIPVGYADGYPRILSNKASVLVRGQKAPIIGRVCMDQMMVDISGIIGEVKQGDIVTLIGRDGDLIITADELGELADTIGYEIVCGVSKRVPRVYV